MFNHLIFNILTLQKYFNYTLCIFSIFLIHGDLVLITILNYKILFCLFYLGGSNDAQI